MRIIDVEQRSEGWFAARAGRLTGSRAGDMLAKIKSGEAAARRDLRMQLAIETLTGVPLDGDGFVSKEMQRGIDLEPAAFSAYEALTGNIARKTGFIVRDDLPVGCSLDGDIDGLKGILELKAPKPATHVGYLKGGTVPREYVPQITHNLWITGAAWCDFLSYDDRLPPELRAFLVRVRRQEVNLLDYEKSALAFLAEVAAEVDALRGLIRERAA